MTETFQAPALPENVTRLTPQTRAKTPKLCIIVPVHNEEDAISPFLKAIMPVLGGLEAAPEILFVNDGSRDNTLTALLAAADENPHISVLNLARNFGKEAAMSAGLDVTDADAVIIIDVDLQDPVDLIPKFLARWREGYDVVYGERSDRTSDGWLKRRTAAGFYRIFNLLSPTKIPSNTGDFRLIDRRVVLALRRLPERNRFMKGLFAWVGFSSIGVAFERPKRIAGQTNFKFRNLWSFALDGIFGFSTVPLKLISFLGGMVSFMAFAYALFVIIRTLVFGVDTPGYASLMVVLLLVSGLQLFALGIIGEYIARLTKETKQRPIYIVENHYVNTKSE